MASAGDGLHSGVDGPGTLRVRGGPNPHDPQHFGGTQLRARGRLRAGGDSPADPWRCQLDIPRSSWRLDDQGCAEVGLGRCLQAFQWTDFIQYWHSMKVVRYCTQAQTPLHSEGWDIAVTDQVLQPDQDVQACHSKMALPLQNISSFSHFHTEVPNVSVHSFAFRFQFLQFTTVHIDKHAQHLVSGFGSLLSRVRRLPQGARTGNSGGRWRDGDFHPDAHHAIHRHRQQSLLRGRQQCRATPLRASICSARDLLRQGSVVSCTMSWIQGSTPQRGARSH